MDKFTYSKRILSLEEARIKIAITNKVIKEKNINKQTEKVLKELKKLTNMITNHFVKVQHNGLH